MLSSSSSLSDALCVRFCLEGCSAELWFAVVAVAGCSGALAEDSGMVVRAEVIREEEAGEFGVAGRSEAIRGLGSGVVSSARTNA